MWTVQTNIKHFRFSFIDVASLCHFVHACVRACVYFICHENSAHQMALTTLRVSKVYG